MDNLKAVALKMARALEAGDIEAYVEALNFSRVNHYALHSSCDSDTLRKFFQELSPWIRGGKACGAGGGGFMMVHVRPDCRKQCIERAEALGGLVWNCQLDNVGLMTWEESPSASDQLEAIRQRI
jgi:D-glycero-alpha-D-manno-heptose-7-phosphate kinase